jgi:receptor protein-tyrosine kinase
MKTYVEIGSSSVIMSDLREELQLPADRPTSVNIEIIPDSELLRITVGDYDPVLASNIASALVSYLMNDTSIRDVKITLMEPPSIPEPPSKFSVTAIYVLAVFVGLLGGLGLTFLLENVDPRFYDEKQVESITKFPVLGSIPSITGWRTKKLIAGRFPFNHAFHRLGINLQSKVHGKKLQRIMVTSPGPREGKSTVAVNLAFSLARSGYKTVLIDMDMYRPSVHRYFGLKKEPGLSDVLMGNTPLENVAKETSLPGLSVITSGSMPEELEDFQLNGKQVEKLLGQLVRHYDYVILDTPAFQGLADSILLSATVDSVLVVTRLGMTRQVSLTTTCNELERGSTALIGLVVNQTAEAPTIGHYHIFKFKWKPILSLLTKGRLLQNLFHRAPDAVKVNTSSDLNP